MYSALFFRRTNILPLFLFSMQALEVLFIDFPRWLSHPHKSPHRPGEICYLLCTIDRIYPPWHIKLYYLISILLSPLLPDHYQVLPSVEPVHTSLVGSIYSSTYSPFRKDSSQIIIVRQDTEPIIYKLSDCRILPFLIIALQPVFHLIFQL